MREQLGRRNVLLVTEIPVVVLLVIVSLVVYRRMLARKNVRGCKHCHHKLLLLLFPPSLISHSIRSVANEIFTVTFISRNIFTFLTVRHILDSTVNPVNPR